MTVGYSGTPLAAKLGLKQGQRAWWPDMPDSVRAEIAHIGVIEQDAPTPGLDCVHLFVAQRADLQARLAEVHALLAPAGMVWVSWPKKASGAPSELNDNVVREVALPMGLVDVKVCAVDAVWSGLKLVIRSELRRG